jgi:heptosyltransferase III
MRRILVLQCRNFGDAVVGTGLVEALGRSLPEARIELLTRPQFRALYAGSPYVAAVHEAHFPMGTSKQFGPGAALQLLRRIAALRRARFDTVVDLWGDVREIGLGWSIAPRGVCSVVWPANHPLGGQVRSGLPQLLSLPVPIPAAQVSMYAVTQTVAQALGATAPARPRLYDAQNRPYVHAPENGTIALHLSANQPWRAWPAPRWRDLVKALRAAGMKVVACGAPNERERLLADLEGALDSGVKVATGSLPEFFERLSRAAAFVGLDSFAIHAAHAIGVPSVMLNGANLAAIVCPPGTELLESGAGLPCYPCFNHPTCGGEERPYRCIRDTTEAQVLERLRRLGVLHQA